jgi:perosamine synthetase
MRCDLARIVAKVPAHEKSETENGSQPTSMNLHSLQPPSTPGPPFTSDIAPYLQQLVADGSWANYLGSALDQLTSDIRSYTGCDSLLCSSGSIAVELALKACKTQAGDEVILAGYDYPGNFRCIEAVNALAVVIDVSPNSWSMDLDQLRSAITPQTKAIIVSHLHGEIQDLIAIKEIADRRGIVVIEDACQAMGGRLAGAALGSLGHIGIWSFGGSKLLTAGRGGALLCNDVALLQRARVASQRSNDAFALSQLQAAVLLPQMQNLSQATQQRYENARILAEALRSTAGWESVHSVPSMASQPVAHLLPAFYKLGVIIHAGAAERDRVIQESSVRGAEVGPGFRGFASRSAHRCRRVSELVHAREAGERTLLIHHRHLTANPLDLQFFAKELHKIVQEKV